LAGCGGEGKKVERLVECGSGGGGCKSALVRERRARRRSAKPILPSFLLSVGRGGVEENKKGIDIAAGSLFIFKCCLCFSGSPRAALAHLDAHGSEEVEKGRSMVTEAVGGFRELLEFRLSTAFSKRRRYTVAAILGQIGGRIMLGAEMCANFFFVVSEWPSSPLLNQVVHPRLGLGWRRLDVVRCRRVPRT
jgi:hypothetical protein